LATVTSQLLHPLRWCCVKCVLHHERDVFAATVRSFAHMPLGISDRNKMVLWPGCEGRARVSLQKKNVRSRRFVVKRRGCCCNLSGGVALNVWFTTNGMCVKNNIRHTCGANKQ